VNPERLDLLKSAEHDLTLLVEKAKTKPGRGGTLVLGDDGHWRLQDKQQTGDAAKKADFRVKADTPLKDSSFSIKAGTQITGVKVMASGNKIRQVNELVKDHPFPNGMETNPKDWEKVRGTALVTDGKTTFKTEIHWYQCKNIGKVRFKRKENNKE
jgi:hypothetical protein